MKAYVICEFTGTVRQALRDRGHDAYSIDIDAAEDHSPFHIRADCRTIDYAGVDLVIAHPPCTALAVCGARWFKDKLPQQREALDLVRFILALPVPRLALENPVSIISTLICRPTQIVNPWEFGHGETKKTCLWLRNLPRLVPTNIVAGREARIHKMPPGPDRGKDRSRTYAGIAAAMAEQWGSL